MFCKERPIHQKAPTPLLLPLVLSLISLNQYIVGVQSHNPICRRIPNLSAAQVKLCQRSPDIVPVIRAGVQLAQAQCERLFSVRQRVHPAWDCSSWIRNSTNGLFLDITHPDVIGTKEAAFGYALFSAGVTYALAEACTRANYSYCLCGSTPAEAELADDSGEDSGPGRDSSSSDWQWQGCPQNAEYGVAMARLFLDSKEQSKMSPYALANLHNNLVGRRAVKSEYVTRCQCHGYSGSCSARTCWRTLRVFPSVADTLYRRYESAQEVTLGWLIKWFRAKYGSPQASGSRKQRQSNGGKQGTRRAQASKLEWLKQLQRSMTTIVQLELNQPNAKRIGVHEPTDFSVTRQDLLYVKQSVDYCDLSVNKHLPCKLRPANSTAENSIVDLAVDTCDELCCGRGYRPKTVMRLEKCQCEFKFCCSLECHSECSTPTTEYECL